MTRKCFQKCEFISPSPLDICDSIRSEFDQVPTSCEPLFGSTIQVIRCILLGAPRYVKFPHYLIKHFIYHENYLISTFEK